MFCYRHRFAAAIFVSFLSTVLRATLCDITWFYNKGCVYIEGIACGVHPYIVLLVIYNSSTDLAKSTEAVVVVWLHIKIHYNPNPIIHFFFFLLLVTALCIYVTIWFVFLGHRQQEERMASKMASVRWAPDLILYLDCLEVSLQTQGELEFVCVNMCTDRCSHVRAS